MPPVVVWCSQSTFEDSMLSSSVALLADCVASRANITVMFHGTNATQAFQRESGVAEWVPPHIQPQRVTLNLCRLAARTNTASSFFEALPDLVELALKAHDRKRLFLDRLLARGVRGPLGPFAFTYDGAPLFDPERAEWITGFTGLNECVSLLCGSEMHESPEALTLGAQITSTLNDSLMQAGLDRAMRLTLAPSDMPGIAQRFALLDLKNEPARVRSVFKIAADGVTPTYTSGLRLRNDAPMNILERLRVEGMLHEPVPGCTVSEAVLPDEPISRQSIAGLLYKTVRDTAVQGVRFRQPVLRV
jgi:ribonucleoside-triphosphate reductase